MHPIARLGIFTIVLTLVLAAFTWPSGRLAPHDLPLGVVGRAAGRARERGLRRCTPTAPRPTRERRSWTARSTAPSPGATALVATGASPAVAAAIRQAAPQARVVDLAPGTKRDPRAATLGALALPLTLIGIATALMAFFTARGVRRARRADPRRRRDRRRGRRAAHADLARRAAGLVAGDRRRSPGWRWSRSPRPSPVSPVASALPASGSARC